MRKSLTLLGLLSLVIIFMSSCEKDDDSPEDTSKSTTEYLTSGYWKVTAMTISPGINFGGIEITDFYAQQDACTKDDLTKFNSNGTITDDEGATKCDVNDPQTTNDGTWALSADNSSLTISYPGEDALTMSIIQLDGSVFKGNYIIVEDFGAGLLTYTIAITLSFQ